MMIDSMMPMAITTNAHGGVFDDERGAGDTVSFEACVVKLNTALHSLG